MIRAVVRFPEEVRTIREPRRHKRTSFSIATHVDKLGESRVAPLLLLELVLAVQLVGTVLDVRAKVRHEVEEDVADMVDDVRLLLSLVEELAQSDIDRIHLEHVPEDLGDKVFSSGFGDDVLRPQGFDPELQKAGERNVSAGSPGRVERPTTNGTNIPKVLEISNKVSLGVEHLVDRFLSLLFQIRSRIDHLLRNRMDPERTRFLHARKRKTQEKPRSVLPSHFCCRSSM